MEEKNVPYKKTSKRKREYGKNPLGKKKVDRNRSRVIGVPIQKSRERRPAIVGDDRIGAGAWGLGGVVKWEEGHMVIVPWGAGVGQR